MHDIHHSLAGINNTLTISVAIGNTEEFLGLRIQSIHRSLYGAGIVGISHGLGKINTIFHRESTGVGGKNKVLTGLTALCHIHKGSAITEIQRNLSLTAYSRFTQASARNSSSGRHFNVGRNRSSIANNTVHGGGGLVAHEGPLAIRVRHSVAHEGILRVGSSERSLHIAELQCGNAQRIAGSNGNRAIGQAGSQLIGLAGRDAALGGADDHGIDLVEQVHIRRRADIARTREGKVAVDGGAGIAQVDHHVGALQAILGAAGHHGADIDLVAGIAVLLIIGGGAANGDGGHGVNGIDGRAGYFPGRGRRGAVGKRHGAERQRHNESQQQCGDLLRHFHARSPSVNFLLISSAQGTP